MIKWPIHIFVLIISFGCATTQFLTPEQQELTSVEQEFLSKAKYMGVNTDDWDVHRKQFIVASMEMVRRVPRCNLNDFAPPFSEAGSFDGGGWFKSTAKFPKDPIYFKYCSPPHASTRYYLNVQSGQLFQVDSNERIVKKFLIRF